MRRISCISMFLVTLASAGPVSAAPPNVPTSLPYQGLLLDGLGDPRTGSVDLTVRVFDAVVGGTLVYKQSFPAVLLADGVFTVQLGPTGEGTDSPANPLTTSLSTALAGDAGITAPVRFLEVIVGGDGALSRTQILASAYAVRASSAASADTATTAANATQVGGLSSTFVTELWEHYDADGGQPPNTDAREGLGDVDGDGMANFIDVNNDGDAYSDVVELGQGGDINLVTPTLGGMSPSGAPFNATLTVSVSGGANLIAPLSVSFGNQNPTPTNVTSTGFQVAVGPQPPGVAFVTVTNANGQVNPNLGTFQWIQTFAHPVVGNPGTFSFQSSIDVRVGTNFVVLSGQKQYGIGDFTSSLTAYSLGSRGTGGQVATAFEPTGRLNGLRCISSTGTNCSVEVLADADSDHQLEDETAIPIEIATGANTLLNAATLRFDPSGHRVAAYQRSDGTTGTPMVANDRNGDGDFVDAGELVSAGASVGSAAIPSALAIDAAGSVAYVRGAGGAAVAAWDRNGDGDFADTVGGNSELFTIAPAITPSCIGATFDSAGRLAVVYGSGGQVTLVRDLNADGDFGDGGESAVLQASGANYCDIDRRSGQPLTVAHSSGSTVAFEVDKNDDGDFADAGELATVIGNAGSTALRLRLNGTTGAVVNHGGFISIGATN